RGAPGGEPPPRPRRCRRPPPCRSADARNACPDSLGDRRAVAGPRADDCRHGVSLAEEGELRRILLREPDLVLPAEAGMAEAAVVTADRLQHAFQGEVADRVRGEVAADLLHPVAGADQLLSGRRVDPVVARPPDRRRGDAHVDLPRAGSPDHLDDLAACRPPDDGVVHDDDALSLDGLPHRVQLDADAEVPDALAWLDEGPA